MNGPPEFQSPDIAQLQPHFPQYKIERCVAVGHSGAVYRATTGSGFRPVAIKVLPIAWVGAAGFRERFEREAKALVGLSHRHLLPVHGFGQSGDLAWTVQEWVEGRTLAERLQEEGPLDPEEATALLRQACEGLGHAHEQGIVHGEVRTSNLMEDKVGTLKVMDFELGRGGGAGRQDLASYAAPEIVDPERAADHRADIFALGVALFEALTGQRPSEVFRRPGELRPALNSRYDAIAIRALQQDPEARFQSCAEFQAALEEAVADPLTTVPARALVGAARGGQDTDSPSLVPIAEATGRKWLLASAAAGAVLGIGGWWLNARDKRPEFEGTAPAAEHPQAEGKPGAHDSAPGPGEGVEGARR